MQAHAPLIEEVSCAQGDQQRRRRQSIGRAQLHRPCAKRTPETQAASKGKAIGQWRGVARTRMLPFEYNLKRMRELGGGMMISSIALRISTPYLPRTRQTVSGSEGRLNAHGHLTDYNSGLMQCISSRCPPSIRRSMGGHTPSVGPADAACAGPLRKGGPHQVHVDRHLPKTARRAGGMSATPSAPAALTPFPRVGAHLAPGRAHLGEKAPPSRLLWFRLGKSAFPVSEAYDHLVTTDATALASDPRPRIMGSTPRLPSGGSEPPQGEGCSMGGFCSVTIGMPSVRG